jgi:murein DD-endopeptidase MepM/ murein hydrolase activator NlpD
MDTLSQSYPDPHAARGGTVMPARIPLPFGSDDPNGVYVSQSFGGAFSHQDTLHYSVDFLLGFDASVLSQGNGTVVEVVENVPDGKSASEGDSDPSMGVSRIGNFVTVRYDEGFYATYQHLKQDGVEVNEGDTITPHDLLGHAGNTGYRTDTHLHVTYGDEPIQWQAGIIANGSLSANNNTEPVLFSTPEDSDGILDAGKYYHGDNFAPRVVASDQTIALEGWYDNVESWFSVQPSNEKITYWALFDGGDDPLSGWFWIQDKEFQQPTTAFVVSSEELASKTWFGGAREAGTETLYAAAWDGTQWSEWAALTVTILNDMPLV